MTSASLRVACGVLSVLTVLAGGLGMAISFLFLGSNRQEDIAAGAAGFVAGAILIGSGLVSLSLIATRGDQAGDGAGQRAAADPSNDEGRRGSTGFTGS